MLKLESVKKVYCKQQHEVVALDSTSIEIAQGEFAAIIGPSGSGKTTLLSMLRINPVKENKLAIGRAIKMADSDEPVTKMFI